MPTAVLTPTRVSEGKPKQTVSSSPLAITKAPTSNSTPIGFPLFLQPKLAVSQPDDPYEQEADRVAEQVMRMPEPTVQRKCAACAGGGGPPCPACEEEEPVRVSRKGQGVTASDAPASVNSVLHSPGQPLASSARAFFEPRMGYDLSSVRIHTGGTAAESAKAINAKAYTLGSNIVFGSGEYQPESESGKLLIGHELAHTIQHVNQLKAILRKPTGHQDKIHDPILDDFSKQTGMLRDEASHHSQEYEDWLNKKHERLSELEEFKIKAEHLKIPAIIQRFERMTLEELYDYRLNYIIASGEKPDEFPHDPVVIKYLTDLMMSRPTQNCSKKEAKEAEKIANQALADAPAMVNNALKAITLLLSRWIENKSDLIAGKSVFTGEVACAFRSNLNISETNANWGVTAINVERRLMSLQKRLLKAVSFVCEPINSKVCLESKGRDAEAYVVNHTGPIHLCYGFRDSSIYSFQVSTIIHEMLHFLPGLGDNGGYAAFSTSAMTCKPGLQFSAAPDVLDNTADAITGFIMHIENTSATDLQVSLSKKP